VSRIHWFYQNNETRERNAMRWTKPVIREISVGLEINAYACASL
jgi:coenzyme PQQ precursor peptide PqqA